MPVANRIHAPQIARRTTNHTSHRLILSPFASLLIPWRLSEPSPVFNFHLHKLAEDVPRVGVLPNRPDRGRDGSDRPPYVTTAAAGPTGFREPEHHHRSKAAWPSSGGVCLHPTFAFAFRASHCSSSPHACSSLTAAAVVMRRVGRFPSLVRLSVARELASSRRAGSHRAGRGECKPLVRPRRRISRSRSRDCWTQGMVLSCPWSR